MSRIVFLMLMFLGTAASTFAQEAFDAEKEMKVHEGRWVRRFKNPAGAEFLTVKAVTGDRSEVTTFDNEGRILEAHVSRFKVEKQGPVKTLTFFDLEVTIGPQKGFKQPAGKTYIYRIEGDHFFEMHGMLEGDRQPPILIYWQREAAAAPAAEEAGRPL